LSFVISGGYDRRLKDFEILRLENLECGKQENIEKERVEVIRLEKMREREEKRAAKVRLAIRSREKKNRMFRRRLVGRTHREKAQETRKKAATQAKMEMFGVMVAYLKEYLVLTKYTLDLPTCRSFLLGQELVTAELGTAFVDSLGSFVALMRCDTKRVTGHLVEMFLTFLYCQEQAGGKDLTSTVSLELAMMRTGHAQSALYKHILDYNLRMCGGGEEVALEMEQSRAFYDDHANTHVDVVVEEVDDTDDIEAAEDLRLELEAEEGERRDMADADKATANYCAALAWQQNRQKANNRKLKDQRIAIAETDEMRVEDKRSRNEEERYRILVAEQKRSAMGKWVHDRKMSAERKRVLEEAREAARKRREERLAKGLVDTLAPTQREEEERVWIFKTESEEEQETRRLRVQLACGKAAAVALHAVWDIIEELGLAIAAGIAAREKQLLDARVALYNAQRWAMNDPEMQKVRQAAETVAMRKEETQMQFLVRKELALLRKMEREAKAAVMAAALRASDVAEAAVQYCMPIVGVALLWTEEAADTRRENLALLDAAEKKEAEKGWEQIQAEREEENKNKKKKRKIEKRLREEAEAARHHAQLVAGLQADRLEAWIGKVVIGMGYRVREGGLRSLNDVEALEDVEGEAGLRVDMRQEKRWSNFKEAAKLREEEHREKAYPYPQTTMRTTQPVRAGVLARRYWQMRLDTIAEEGEAVLDVGSNNSSKEETAKEVELGRRSYARDVYVEARGRYTSPLDPVITPIRPKRAAPTPGDHSKLLSPLTSSNHLLGSDDDEGSEIQPQAISLRDAREERESRKAAMEKAKRRSVKKKPPKGLQTATTETRSTAT
jgi:hypothetical protein